MAELKPGQIEVNGYRIDGGGIWSGERRPVKYNVFDPGGLGSATKALSVTPGGDGRSRGRTTLDGRDVAIEMYVDCANVVDASRAYADLAAVWYDPAIRLRDDFTTVALRYRPFPGLPTRVMYGWPDPGKFTPTNEYLLEVGRVDIVAGFETADPLCWEDPELISPIVIPITPPLSGGFTSPIRTPIRVGGGAEGFGEFHLGGSVPTPLVARVNGPISTPVLDYLGQWKLQIDAPVLYDQHIDIDARPQVRTVIRSDGRNLSGKLSGPPLSDLLLYPGPGEMVLRGNDSTGTANLVLSPQAASATPYW